MTATINFTKDWQENLTGELSSGAKFAINYDESKAYFSNLTRAKYEFWSDMILKPLPGGR
ncbi:MAG: hypothetical protein V7K40_32595 [Nostoc sp.]|uniref:hypothetical protein n=1 Tax=Nostoc sp. TaxID=1180 RepID=UPI002FFA0FBA